MEAPTTQNCIRFRICRKKFGKKNCFKLKTDFDKSSLHLLLYLVFMKFLLATF